MSDKLRPCPFCGSKAKTFENSFRELHIRCLGKDCQVSFPYWKKDVVAAWNTRPRERAAKTSLARLERLYKDEVDKVCELTKRAALSIRYEEIATLEAQLHCDCPLENWCSNCVWNAYVGHLVETITNMRNET